MKEATVNTLKPLKTEIFKSVFTCKEKSKQTNKKVNKLICFLFYADFFLRIDKLKGKKQEKEAN